MGTLKKRQPDGSNPLQVEVIKAMANDNPHIRLATADLPDEELAVLEKRLVQKRW